jgi:branched-chain amino acid transport system substrate-binding protein
MNGKPPNDVSGAAILPNRRQIIQAGGVAVGTAALSGFPAPRVRAAGPVKIGYVSPQTGALAPFAAADGFVIAGVRDLFKKQSRAIEIIVKDSQSSSARASDVALDLILRDKVSLVLVGAAPETDNPVSDQCELNEVPCVSTVSPWQPWFFVRGGKPDKPFKWTLSLLLGSRGCHCRLHRHVAATGDEPRRRRRVRQRRGRQRLG